jgi:hypothetical protein
MELKKSNRSAARIRVALQGTSGSGKSYSSLLLGYGLTKDWTKIAVIDTENKSAHLYSHLGDYFVLNLSAPFTPERYIEAIDTCENAGMEVIIIDSISHEWEGDGGILDMHSQLAGNSFTNWSKLTPRHNSLVQKIIASNSHIIATVRSKQDYVITEKNGKLAPEKVGMKGVQRDGLEYDFTIFFELDIYNNATSTKDRTQLFNPRIPLKIDISTGTKILEWCNSGSSKENDEVDIPKLINSCLTIEELTLLYKSNPEVRKFDTELHTRAAILRNLTAPQNGINNHKL